MHTMRSAPFVIAGLAGLLVACGGETTPSSSTTGRLCAGETRADTFAVGLEKTSDNGAFVLRLEDSVVEGQFGPPDRGDNVWLIDVFDAAGAPLTDLEEVKLKPWMPDHGHGTTPELHFGARTEGRYEFGPFRLHMGGFWEFRFTVTSSSTEDAAKFGFCVEG